MALLFSHLFKLFGTVGIFAALFYRTGFQAILFGENAEKVMAFAMASVASGGALACLALVFLEMSWRSFAWVGLLVACVAGAVGLSSGYVQATYDPTFVTLGVGASAAFMFFASLALERRHESWNDPTHEAELDNPAQQV